MIFKINREKRDRIREAVLDQFDKLPAAASFERRLLELQLTMLATLSSQLDEIQVVLEAMHEKLHMEQS